MQLFIHFGIYKAGSSYIQYACVENKAYLKTHGYLFPDSAEDQKMLAGKISKGNAGNLSDDIKFNRPEKVKLQLTKWVKQANKERLNKILISSEAMVHQLARKDGIELLLKACDNAGITKVHAMGFFRDLVDHAISTYKHRAKTGKHPDFEHWLQYHYETPEVLKNLADIYLEYDSIVWTFRYFKKDSNYMIKAFFEEWLNIKILSLPSKPQVNESLNLSEIMVMNEVRAVYPIVKDYFVDRLKNLPASKKYKDIHLEKLYKSKSGKIINSRIEVTAQGELNVYETDEDELNKISNYEHTYPKIKEPVRLSNEQIKEILKTSAYFSTISGKLMLLRRRILRILKYNKVFCLYYIFIVI